MSSEKLKAAIASAIWMLMREDRDECDKELSDLHAQDPVFRYTDAAIAAWNTRAPAQDSGELPEAVAKAMEIAQHIADAEYASKTVQKIHRDVLRAHVSNALDSSFEKGRQEGIAQERARQVDENVSRLHESIQKSIDNLGNTDASDLDPQLLAKAEAFLAQPSAPSVPGWMLVPVEPTELMVDAVVTSLDDDWIGNAEQDERMRNYYRAMLAAAPQPPTSNSVEFDGIKTPRPQVELTDAEQQRSQHDADSKELRNLCAARDVLRRDRDLQRVEIAALNSSVSHLSRLVDELRPGHDNYQYLRNRPLDTIQVGGVFAGQTPENHVLNGADLDFAIAADRAKNGRA